MLLNSITDYQGQCQQMAFVQYGFDRNEHPIDVKPHGNSKGKKPFSRCKASTLKMLKRSAEAKPPLQALRQVENIRGGGVVNAKSGCDLPRNRKQVYNLNYNRPQTTLPKSIPRTDVLAQVMLMCKETSGSQAYVRSVEAAPEPMCILATDQQLADLVRFSTSDPFCVLNVDPTFNLGPFYVTPITYQNLLVETNKGNHAIVLGPVLIHKMKTFRPFHYFASTLIRLNPQVAKLKAFGTDGEPELIKAFSVAFPGAVHLRCVNHMRQNVKDKLHALNIPRSIWKDFLDDIFGSQIGSHFEMGLIDAESDTSFWKALEQLRTRWNNLERGCIQPGSLPQFHGWFCQYKANDIVDSVLPTVRAKAGIRDPSHHFTTNASESLNHIIKQEVNWKENKLPVLIEHLRSIADRNTAELEKAVIGRGEWHFTSQYSYLQVPEATWFSGMSSVSRERHIKKVLNCEMAGKMSHDKPAALSMVSATTSSHSEAENHPPTPSTVLEVAAKDCGVTTVSMSILDNMWKKAERLVQSDGGILKVPWSRDKKARLVMSSSSEHPHLVKTNGKNLQYSCDEKCPMFKGFSLCSHIIAACHDNGDLRSFLENYKRGPNLTAIANHGMPSGSGRKGGIPKRKRRCVTPIQTRSVRQCLQHVQSTGKDSSPFSAASPDSLSPSTTAGYNTTPCEPTHSLNCTPVTETANPNFTPTSGSQLIVSNSSLVVGGSVALTTNPLTRTQPTPALLSRPSCYLGPSVSGSNPFVLKFKTKQIKVCQACRKNYDGTNDTLGLVVARMERRMVSNLITGANFIGRESNSHYHAHMHCLRQASPSFSGGDLVVPEDVKKVLSPVQKFYLITCLQAVL